MGSGVTSKLVEILQKYEEELIEEWVKEQLEAVTIRRDLMSDVEMREQSREFVGLFGPAIRSGSLTNVTGPEWSKVRDMLSRLSKFRAEQGYSPTETATFVLSFKQPLFERLRLEHGDDSRALVSDVWLTTVLLDKLGLLSAEVHLKSSEEIITRQQAELMELSTPVVQLWPGILCLPLIGTLDSERTQVVMESLLQRISDTGSEITIIDITGVPTVDTLVAQQLLKTVSAARLMGADCIISGIRPQIALTVFQLGVNLSDVTIKASLFSALELAMKTLGLAVRSHDRGPRRR